MKLTEEQLATRRVRAARDKADMRSAAICGRDLGDAWRIYKDLRRIRLQKENEG